MALLLQLRLRGRQAQVRGGIFQLLGLGLGGRGVRGKDITRGSQPAMPPGLFLPLVIRVLPAR